MRVNERIGAFVDGLGTFFIGIIMVFMTLLLLIILIKLVGIVVAKIENRKLLKTVSASSTKVEIEEPKSVVTVAQQEISDEKELVAVITAAIAASLGTTTDKLQVRSLRKVERRRSVY